MDLQKDFPTEETCLAWILEWRFPNGVLCKVCRRVTKHYPEKERRSYACGSCGNHLHPTAGTIFHRSRLPLTQWFYAMYLITSAKAGVPATQIQRHLGVTYKTAWRMMHQIRKLMQSKDAPFSREVEVDESYLHPNVYKRSSARKKYGPTGARKGQVIFGIVERGGKAKAWHVKAPGTRVLIPLITEHVQKGSIIYSDSYGAYRTLNQRGYHHFTTNHSIGQFVDGRNYTQNIENVWSHMKRGIKGVYRHVSPKYLQAYIDEFTWRFSYRKSKMPFWSLLVQLA